MVVFLGLEWCVGKKLNFSDYLRLVEAADGLLLVYRYVPLLLC